MCALLLACNAVSEARPPDHLFSSQGSATEAEIAKYPCLRYTRRIRFYYHGTCILTYDVQSQRVTDHGTYGWSVTTSRALRWDLGALCDESYISPQRREEIYKEMRKNQQGRTDPNAPWYTTR
jgi:hypothetical protein